jgi:hypothetical protein
VVRSPPAGVAVDMVTLRVRVFGVRGSGFQGGGSSFSADLENGGGGCARCPTMAVAVRRRRRVRRRESAADRVG